MVNEYLISLSRHEKVITFISSLSIDPPQLNKFKYKKFYVSVARVKSKKGKVNPNNIYGWVGQLKWLF